MTNHGVTVADVSKNMIGAAGEYYVCAELCRRNVLALVTPKNNPLFDVVATDPRGRRSVSIQVKTMALANKQGWKLSPEVCVPRHNPDLFVVLVKMHEGGANDFYIYNHDEFAGRVCDVYDAYIGQPKRDGSARKDVGFRWFDFRNMNEDDRARRNAWNLLRFELHQLA